MSVWKKFFLALKEYLRTLIIFILAYAVSWAAIVGIIWSILKLFGLSISILTATYVWLGLLLIDGISVITLDRFKKYENQNIPVEEEEYDI